MTFHEFKTQASELKEQYHLIQKYFQAFLVDFKKQTRGLSSGQLKNIRMCPEYTVIPVHNNVDYDFLEKAPLHL